MFEAATLDDLLMKVFGEIRSNGVDVPGSRGNMRELTCALLKLTAPRARLSRTETRGKVFSALGELAWYLAASDDAEFITYYIPDYWQDAEIDGTMHGAYGPRLFTAAWHNQFENIAKLLRERPATKRAVIQLFDCSDLAGTYKEVPCTSTLQFMIRKDHLDLIVSMRSNDAFLGLPHDIFSFTMLQEIMARTVGCEVGEYSHFAASLHLYDKNAAAVENFLKEGFQPTQEVAMPAMPTGDPWPSIRVFGRAEAAIRARRPLPEEVTSLDSYWQDLIWLLSAFGHWKTGNAAAISELKDKVSRIYRQYVIDRERRAPSASGPDPKPTSAESGETADPVEPANPARDT